MAKDKLHLSAPVNRAAPTLMLPPGGAICPQSAAERIPLNCTMIVHLLVHKDPPPFEKNRRFFSRQEASEQRVNAGPLESHCRAQNRTPSLES